MVVASEESLKVLLEKIPRCKLHGESVDCRFATRQNLSMFEEMANKRKCITVLRKYCYLYMTKCQYGCPLSQQTNVFSVGIPLRVNSKDPKDSESSEKIPSLLSQESNPPPISPLLPSHAHANRFPLLPSPFLCQPPPFFSHMPPSIPPPLPPTLFPPPLIHGPSQPSSSLHINPALFAPGQDGHSSKDYSQQK